MLCAGKGMYPMLRSKRPGVRILLPKSALEAIFDECDHFEVDETGGRIVGFYRKVGDSYEIEVSGIIGPGQKARRTATSFFQDGEYQEKIFRLIEEKYPSIEHLGNWHTHHVNGLAVLSSGDRATYQKIVNHEKHNTDFLYAILVVEKTAVGRQRYKTKHYLLRRHDSKVYEVPDSQIDIIDKPTVWPLLEKEVETSLWEVTRASEGAKDGIQERVKDQEFFAEFHPSIRPLLSKTVGAFYWKGKLDLIDGRSIDILILENQDTGKPRYTISVKDEKLADFDSMAKCTDQFFNSARQAVFHLERHVNREIFLKQRVAG